MVVYRLEYNNDEENSHKFWQAIPFEHGIETRWGRIGKKGQRKFIDMDNPFDRDQFITKKIEEKERKGYVRCF